MEKNKSLCIGCRDNFYNAGNNPLGVNECRSYKNAEVVKRWQIGWWTPQDKKENFTRVTTLNCHSAPGKYANLKRLPEHLGGEEAGSITTELLLIPLIIAAGAIALVTIALPSFVLMSTLAKAFGVMP